MSSPREVIEKLDKKIGEMDIELDEMRAQVFDEEGELRQEDEADDQRYAEYKEAEAFRDGLVFGREIVLELEAETPGEGFQSSYREVPDFTG